MKRRGELNEREQRFLVAYIEQPNGTRAAIVAGYSPRTATQQASRLLTRANVQAAIERWRIDIVKQTQIDAAYVLKQAFEMCERCMQHVRPVIDRTGQQKIEDGHPLYMFNASGAARALEIIGSHKSVRAFVEKRSARRRNHCREGAEVDPQREIRELVVAMVHATPSGVPVLKFG
jgi:phage terminase small subunit